MTPTNKRSLQSQFLIWILPLIPATAGVLVSRFLYYNGFWPSVTWCDQILLPLCAALVWFNPLLREVKSWVVKVVGFVIGFIAWIGILVYIELILIAFVFGDGL